MLRMRALMLALIMAIAGGLPRDTHGSTHEGDLLILELQRGDAMVELRVADRKARFTYVSRDRISPRRFLGELTYTPVEAQPTNRHHDVAKRWQIRGHVVDASSGRPVHVLRDVVGIGLVPAIAEYFNTMQATNNALLTTEDSSRLFGMTLNSFKQTGLIPIYEQQNPR